MNKYQEALDNVKADREDVIGSSADGYIPYTTPDEIKLLQELVDRATPMTPIMSDSGFHTCKCSARLKENDNYCWQCGQAIDWK